MAMETLLLSLAQLVLGITSASPAEIPPALLQPHPKTTLESVVSGSAKDDDQNYLIDEDAAETNSANGSASDSNVKSAARAGGKANRGSEPDQSSLKLHRGPLGEAFVVSDSPQISQMPIQKPPTTTSISDTPIKTPADMGPALRPNMSLPNSGASDDLRILKPDGTGASIDRNPSMEPLQLRDKQPAVERSRDFPSDIDDISPSTTTDDQVPEKPMVSGSVTYEEQKNENISGGAPLSIFSALDQALVKSPRAAALRALLPVTQSELARATEQPGPDWMYDNGVKAEQTRRTGVVFNWEPPWKLVFRLIAARRLIEHTKQDLLAQLWALRAEVRLAYTEVVVAQETLETLNSLYDLANRLMVVSQKRFKAGDVPELDLLKARLAESQYDVERRVGLRRVIRAKQQLNVIMGRNPEAPLTIPRLPPFLKTEDIQKAATAHNILLPDFSRQIATLEHYNDIAVKHRYELKSLDRQIALNQAQLRNAYGNIVPSPQFWTGSSVTGNPPSGPKLSAYYFGVNVPSNITSFQQGDIAKYKAVARQLRYQTGALKNVIMSEVSSAYNNVLAARQKLRIYQEHVLADSYEVARLARRSYEVGQSDITSTIQAQQQNVQIRTQYLEAIQLYQQAFTELERACGTPLMEADD